MLVVAGPLHAQKAGSSTRAGVQRNAEKGLKDNRYFLYYINYTVTNFGSVEEKDKYADIVRRDILSQFFYMRFIFTDSYRHIRIAQRDLIDLYRAAIAAESARTRAVTDSFAPQAINSGDAKARLYLRLGYRELASARIEATMADNYRTTLYSLRLHKYVRSLKHIKEAKRYAFLARIQLTLSEEEKIKEKRLSFLQIKERIESFAAESDRDHFILMHYDSYYRSLDGSSIFDATWRRPRLEENQDFKKYLDSKI